MGNIELGVKTKSVLGLPRVHVSHVMCHFVVLCFFDKEVELVDGGSVINTGPTLSSFDNVCKKKKIV